MWKWKPDVSPFDRRLVQRHHVRKRHPPQIVEPDHHVAQHLGQIAALSSSRSAMVGTLRFGATYVS